ncbi:MAG: polysaccharide deacetylase family protein [Pseudomonadota bacterium]
MRPWIAKSAAAALRMSGLERTLQAFSGMQGGILMLHRIEANKASSFNPNGMLSITPEFFDRVCDWLASSRYEVITLDEAVERLRSTAGGKRPSGNPFVVLTFDDGYLDNLTQALPILERHNLPATLYPATGLIEGTATMWWAGLEWALDATDELVCDMGEGERSYSARTPHELCHLYTNLMRHCTHALDEREQRQFVYDLCARHGVDLKARTLEQMMTMEQLRSFAAHPLITIGGHTVNHFALGRLDEEHARREVSAGADVLEAFTGVRPKHFAYPYGNPIAAGEREFRILEELGFESAVTTRRGAVFAGHGEHMMALPRLSLNGHFQSMSFTRRWVTGMPALVDNRLRRLNVA